MVQLKTKRKIVNPLPSSHRNYYGCKKIGRDSTKHPKKGGCLMTANQIAYAQLQAQIRKNEADIAQKRAELAENQRHSQVTEGISQGELTERGRSNKANEALTNRYNEARITQSRNELEETARANVARETENTRSNMAKEAENERSNKAREIETKRHDIKMETQAEKDWIQKAGQYALSLGEKARDRLNAQEVAQINALGRQISAEISAKASMYSADQRHEIDERLAELRETEFTFQMVKDALNFIKSLVKKEEKKVINPIKGGRK